MINKGLHTAHLKHLLRLLALPLWLACASGADATFAATAPRPSVKPPLAAKHKFAVKHVKRKVVVAQKKHVRKTAPPPAKKLAAAKKAKRVAARPQARIAKHTVSRRQAVRVASPRPAPPRAGPRTPARSHPGLLNASTIIRQPNYGSWPTANRTQETSLLAAVHVKMEAALPTDAARALCELDDTIILAARCD